MTKKGALKTIVVVAIIGVLFSGFLSYRELFMDSCDLSFVSCGANVAGLPACVYGLVMYLGVLVVSILGLRAKK
jgi:uncharacterized membrane protein